MTQSSQATSSSGLSNFLQDACFGELIAFKHYALSRNPEYSVRGYDLMMPFKELMLEMTRRYQKNQELFENYENKHAELFKVYNSPEQATPFTFTGALFVPAILMLGDEEQVKKWVSMAMEGRLVASYVQTEIAHGSDVQGLTTQATFDFNKKCFVFNTPDIRGIKIWGGASGIIASHIVTQAKLTVGDKSYGLQTFVMRIRDPKTHLPLPGLEIADIGSKIGFKSVDNGFVKFTNFEVPLDGILRKYIEVDEKGNVTVKSDKNSDRLTYGAMMSLRSNLVSLYSFMTSKILMMVADNYKGRNLNLSEKAEFLDSVAENYNLILCCKHMRNEFAEFYKNYVENPKQALKMIKDLHFTTCGLKVFTSQYLVKTGRDQSARNSIGSLALSGICSTYSESVPTVTYEGDSTVLIQQVTQVALLLYNNLKNGKEVKGIADFLNKYKKNAEDDIPLDGAIRIETEGDAQKFVGEVLDNFCFKFLDKTIRDLQKVIMIEKKPMKVATAEVLQNQLVDLGRCLFGNIVIKIADKIMQEESTKQILNKTDMYIMENVLQLNKINQVRLCLNQILELGIVENSDKLQESLNAARLKIISNLLPHYDTITKNGAVTPPEFVNVGSFKDIKFASYQKLNSLLHNVSKGVQSSLNTLSKL